MRMRENWATALTEAADQAAQLEPQSGESSLWAEWPALLKAAADAAKRANEPGGLSHLPAYMALLSEGMQMALGWNGAGILMGWTDPQGRCIHQNEAACDFLALSQEEACTRWHEFVNPEHLPILLQRFDAAKRVRGSWQMFYQLRHRDGEYRWIHTVVRPYKERDGSFGGWIGFGIEVAEAEAVQAA